MKSTSALEAPKRGNWSKSPNCTREERLRGRVFEMYETESSIMAQKKFRLSARINSDNPSGIRPILETLIGGKGSIKSIEDGFEVEVDLEGENARALNRMRVRIAQSGEKNQNPRRMDVGQHRGKVLRLCAKGDSQAKPRT